MQLLGWKLVFIIRKWGLRVNFISSARAPCSTTLVSVLYYFLLLASWEKVIGIPGEQASHARASHKLSGKGRRWGKELAALARSRFVRFKNLIKKRFASRWHGWASHGASTCWESKTPDISRCRRAHHELSHCHNSVEEIVIVRAS